MKQRLTQRVSQKQMLDDFLNTYAFSKKQKHLLKMEKRISVNHNIICHNIALYENDRIDIDIYRSEEDDILPVNMKVTILYEDDLVLIVDKPIHMIVHDDGSHDICLNQGIKHYYQSTSQKHPVRPIHRLDKDTSGCIFYCKESLIQPYFDKMLKEKKIRRSYWAVVKGVITKPLDICKPIGRDRHISNKYRISNTGQYALTHIRPIQSFNNKTLIECQLETGRTHQIRVHLASIAHPLIGDPLYNHASDMRCALHSKKISFIHPLTQKRIHVEAQLPNDMYECLKN